MYQANIKHQKKTNMGAKQKSSINKKEEKITHSERTSVNQQAELILKNVKERFGAVVRVAPVEQ